MNVEEGTISTDDKVDLYYQKVGGGEDYILIPLGFLLYNTLQALASNHRTLIFYDMRNRGRSGYVEDENAITLQKDIDDLETIRSHFNINSFSVIGASYLGKMVIMYALQYPQYITRIIQIAPVKMNSDYETPDHLKFKEPTKPYSEEEIAELRKLIDEEFHLNSPQKFCEKYHSITRRGSVGKPENLHMLDPYPCHLENEWYHNLRRHFEYHIPTVQNQKLEPKDLQDVTHPVLVIHGTYDRAVQYAEGRRYAVHLPNARLVTVEQAAHSIWSEFPELIRTVMSTFLDGSWPQSAEKVKVLDYSPIKSE